MLAFSQTEDLDCELVLWQIFFHLGFSSNPQLSTHAVSSSLGPESFKQGATSTDFGLSVDAGIAQLPKSRTIWGIIRFLHGVYLGNLLYVMVPYGSLWWCVCCIVTYDQANYCVFMRLLMTMKAFWFCLELDVLASLKAFFSDVDWSVTGLRTGLLVGCFVDASPFAMGPKNSKDAPSQGVALNTLLEKEEEKATLVFVRDEKSGVSSCITTKRAPFDKP